jgi:hypothetical protein
LDEQGSIPGKAGIFTTNYLVVSSGSQWGCSLGVGSAEQEAARSLAVIS